MAASAKEDQKKRTVEVDRLRLIEKLKENREKHIQEFEQAMAGFKENVREKIEEEFAKAAKKLERAQTEKLALLEDTPKEEIAGVFGRVCLLDNLYLNLEAPRNYSKEYDAAIGIAEWEVAETMKLTHAEFTCFILDEWDWKSQFDRVTKMYSGS